MRSHYARVEKVAVKEEGGGWRGQREEGGGRKEAEGGGRKGGGEGSEEGRERRREEEGRKRREEGRRKEEEGERGREEVRNQKGRWLGKCQARGPEKDEKGQGVVMDVL